jgi:hypothetical protein
MPKLPIHTWPGACALLLIAAIADADLPPPTNTLVPPVFVLVGTSAGVADLNGRAVVTVRDAANNPMVNCVVQLDFSRCSSDPARDLFVAATQPLPGLQVTCAGQSVLAISGADGRAEFRIAGAAHAVRGTAGIAAPCVVVRVDGLLVNLGNPVRLAAYDQDGSGGVTAADVSLFMDRLFQSPAGYSSRADFNGDGLCNSADLALMLHVLNQAGSVESAGASCF